MNEQEYIEQIISETGYQPTKEQLNYLNAMDELSRQEILLELRNGMTSYGSMQPLPELLKSYGANEQFIKTAQKEIAQWYWSNLGKIAEEGNKLTDFEMEHVFKFSLDKLKELGLSDAEVNNAFMTDDFFKTGLAFTDPGMRTEFDNFLRENAGMSIFEAEDILNEVPDTIPDNMIIENITDTPTNVVDDVIKNKGTINEWFNEAIKEYDLVSGTPTGRKDLLRYSDFEEFLINKKGLKKETAEKIIKDIKTGVVTQIELGPKSTTGISPDFAKATGLTDVGISQNVFKDFGVQNYLDTVYTQTSDLSSSAYNMSFADRQALQNTFYDSLINSDDIVEIYLRQVSSVNVPAENVIFKSQLTQEVPGFYTEPIGGLTPGEMASGGGIKPTENFYKLEINKNNLLIDVPGVNFSNELKTKLDWNLLEKELGIKYSQFKDIDSYQLFHTKLSNVANDLGIDNTKLYSTLRKSGYEGTVGYVNRQVEVVLLDPNDDLKIGKKVNFENSNVDDFYNNQSKVNQLDELVIKPRNVAGAEVIDNLGKTTTSFVDNLPLETVVKNRVKNLVARKSAQLSTPGGLIDAVDAWELFVLGLMAAAVAYSEIEEVPTLVKNSQINMFNNMTSSYDIPPVQPEQYDLDYEFITKVLDTGEKYMPTDIIIKKVGEESKKTYIPYGDFETKKENVNPQETARILKDIATSPASYYRPTSNREAIESMNNQQTTDTMETTQKIQPGVQEEKMFEQARPKKNRSGGSGGGSGARIE